MSLPGWTTSRYLLLILLLLPLLRCSSPRICRSWCSSSTAWRAWTSKPGGEACGRGGGLAGTSPLPIRRAVHEMHACEGCMHLGHGRTVSTHNPAPALPCRRCPYTSLCRLLVSIAQARRIQLHASAGNLVFGALRHWADGAAPRSPTPATLQQEALAALGALIPDSYGQLAEHERTAMLAQLQALLLPPGEPVLVRPPVGLPVSGRQAGRPSVGSASGVHGRLHMHMEMCVHGAACIEVHACMASTGLPPRPRPRHCRASRSAGATWRSSGSRCLPWQRAAAAPRPTCRPRRPPQSLMPCAACCSAARRAAGRPRMRRTAACLLRCSGRCTRPWPRPSADGWRAWRC